MPSLNNKASIQRGGSLKVSRVEQTMHEKADQEDQKYEDALQAEIDKKASTWSRMYAMLNPSWALPAGILMTIIISPSQVV
jgi:hypothetical protein